MDQFFTFINSTIAFGNRGFTLELIICEILFLSSYKFRQWRWKPLPYILAAISLVALIALGFNLPLLSVPGMTPLIVFMASILLQWLIFKSSLNSILFTSVAAYVVQNLTVNFRSIILTYCEFGGWGRWAIKLILTIAVYVATYFIFARRAKNKELNIEYFHLYLMSFISVFIACTLFAILRRSGKIDVYTNIVFVICCLLALLYQFSTFKSANLNKETVLLERLLYYEQKQHDLTQETIDLINLKCHDIKKAVNELKEILGEDAPLLLGDTEEALSIYSDMVKTGNKNLDLVIAEEKLYCTKNGITIDVMADGAQLDFMAPSDIYSLFSNALSNAVGSVIDEEEGNRTISLNVHLNGEYVTISITNVCTHEIKFSGGLPVTSKEDKLFHGYGMRSMEYIVEKYGGNMVVTFENNIFTVKIIIKKPS